MEATRLPGQVVEQASQRRASSEIGRPGAEALFPWTHRSGRPGAVEEDVTESAGGSDDGVAWS